MDRWGEATTRAEVILEAHPELGALLYMLNRRFNTMSEQLNDRLDVLQAGVDDLQVSTQTLISISRETINWFKDQNARLSEELETARSDDAADQETIDRLQAIVDESDERLAAVGTRIDEVAGKVEAVDEAVDEAARTTGTIPPEEHAAMHADDAP